MDYMTVKDASKSWGISVRRIQTLCESGRIEGALKFGRDWALPKLAEKPADARIKSGSYTNWRKRG
ncbi:MAG: helix-turn-helix domain-containing protein [Sedimentibacter sp.]|uniref:helix-turn-helix domain-containing protein n=1 Tax=Sedimentibacter sp. TaxID=1960295 RepID=UPI003158D5FF